MFRLGDGMLIPYLGYCREGQVEVGSGRGLCEEAAQGQGRLTYGVPGTPATRCQYSTERLGMRKQFLALLNVHLNLKTKAVQILQYCIETIVFLICWSE